MNPFSSLVAKNPGIMMGMTAKAQTMEMIKDVNNKTLEIANLPPRKMVFLSCCLDATITVSSVALKIIIEGCKNTSVTLSASVLTGVLELVNCQNVTVNANVSVPTCQIDKSDQCTIRFRSRELAHNIVWANSTRIAITEGDAQTFLLPEPKDVKTESPIPINPNLDQFITRFSDDGIATELLIREGNSGFATESDNKRSEERDAINREIARNALANGDL